MPITGSDQALMFCQSGVERCGATRANYHSAKVFVKVDDVQRATAAAVSTYVVQDLTITETTGGSANTARFTAMGWTPAVGMDVVVTLGSTNNTRRMFAGQITAVTAGYVGASLAQWSVSVADYTWSANGKLVTGYYTGTASAIATSLMEDYAPSGFTWDNIEAGLPTVTGGITFTKVPLMQALRQLAKRVGAYLFVDYHKDLYFYATYPDTLTPPRDLTTTTPITFTDLSATDDLSPVVTRVYVEGGGPNALAECAAGETIIPVEDASWFSASGGAVVSGPQEITYTGRSLGGGGSLVGPGVGPSSAPSVTLAAGAGVTSGAHDVAVVFKTAAGQSLPGPRTSITVGTVDAPTTAPSAGIPTYGGGPDAGTHYYAITYVTAAGETTPSAVSGTITTAVGITDPVTAPSAPAATPCPGVCDLTPAHTYSYKYTWADASGNETLPTAASATGTVTASQRLQFDVTNCTDVRCTRIYVYRSANGAVGPWQRITTYLPGTMTALPYLNNSTGGGTTTIDDSVTGSPSIGVPTVNATGTRTVALTGIPVSASALVLSKNVYGTAAGGSQLKLIANIAAAATSYTVTTADASLGANVPSSNTATANQIAMTGIPLGASGVTDRQVYMTTAGNPGGTLKLALTIANNTATTGTLTASDATLSGAASAPASDTSGISQPAGIILAGATSLVAAGTSWASSGGGWAIVGNGALIRYTGLSGNTLTGIPSTGAGSIGGSVSYNATITAAPSITGVPASGDGAILYTVVPGDPVNVLVTVNDVAAQLVLAALTGGDGIREDTIQDRRLSAAEATARGTAHLLLLSATDVQAQYVSKDINTRAGAPVGVDVSLPDVTDDLKVQQVVISNFTPNIMPDFAVTASNNRFSYEDLLQRQG